MEFEKNNPEWAVNIIAVEADKEDEELISVRQKKVQKKATIENLAKEFLETESKGGEKEKKKKKDKIEMFPYRYVKLTHDKLTIMYSSVM